MLICLVDATETESRFQTGRKILGNEFEVSRASLDVGDWICGKVCIEWKKNDFNNFKHLIYQVRRMVYVYGKNNSHVIIQRSFSNMKRILQSSRPGMARTSIYGFIAEINDIGARTHFVSSEIDGFLLMRSLFKSQGNAKFAGKIPPYQEPISADPVIQFYAGGFHGQGIGEDTAIELKKKFPTPAGLISNVLAGIELRDRDWFDEMGLSGYRKKLIKMSQIIFKGKEMK